MAKNTGRDETNPQVAGSPIERAGLATSPNARDGVWIPVLSSNLCKVKYSPAEALGRLRKGEVRQDKLFVQFWRKLKAGGLTPGKVYVYYGVGRDVWNAFLAASSKGKFLNANVKGVFPFAAL